MPPVALVTGSRTGIGRDLCLHFLEQGYRVAGCSRGEGSIDHADYRHYRLDVADESAVVAMVREVTAALGPISILINNAGAASMNHFITTPLSTFRDLFNVNACGTFLFTREVAKSMMRSKFGRIVNVTTVAVPLTLAGEAAYASSKAAVETLTRITARELGPYGITVNAVGPTPVRTDLVKAVPQAKLDALLDAQAVRRFGEVQDVVNVVDFFVSEASGFVTGQVLYLGGIS